MGRRARLMWSIGVWALLILRLGGCPAALAAVEVYPVHELGRGAVGVGYTVVQGTQIEPFTVEVLGVMERAGPAGSLILVRASGDVIERTGGIASGMSGSPVFIEGKLLGAIGYGFELADHRIGLVTPAADMLRVMDLIRPGGGEPAEATDGWAPAEAEPLGAGRSAAGALGPGKDKGWELPGGIVLAGSKKEAERLAAYVPQDVWVARPIATPLVVRGLGRRAMERLTRLFEGYDVFPVQAGGPPGGEGIQPVIAPGAAIGVQLIRGDVELTAIGTLTAVDDRRFVAFGHSLFNRGEVDHFVTGAYIHHTVPSISFPFKIGAALAPIGSILQDRGAGIAGLLDRRPRAVQLDVRVADRDRRVEREFHVEVVHDKELTVPLLVVAALEAVDRSLDRLGAGTARVRMRIDGEGMPRPLTRENVFYSGSDVAAAALSELYAAVDLLLENEFQDPKLSSVSIDIEVEEGRRTARIERARPSARTVRQGERIDVVVTLRPYRAAPFDVTVPLDIPEGIGSGTVTVTVRGGTFGGETPLPEEDLLSTEDGGEEEPHLAIEAESLEKLIDEFEREPRNNDVVVEFYPPAFYDGGMEDVSAGAEEFAEEGEAAGPADLGDPDGGSGSGKQEDPGGDSADPGEGGEAPGAEGAADESIGDEHGSSWKAGGEDGEPPEEEERRSDRPIRAVLPTEYVIHGEAQFTLTISSEPAERPKAEEEKSPVPAPPADPWGMLEVHPINVN